jgi:PKHD-type hydroxylase
LFQLDAAIQRLPRATPDERANAVQLSNVYHNLLRRWADA